MAIPFTKADEAITIVFIPFSFSFNILKKNQDSPS